MNAQYVMADAGQAQFNAVQSVFGIDCTLTYLMCFYHAIAKVRLALKKRARALHGDVVAMMYTGIYDLHISLTKEEYTVRKERMLFE